MFFISWFQYAAQGYGVLYFRILNNNELHTRRAGYLGGFTFTHNPGSRLFNLTASGTCRDSISVSISCFFSRKWVRYFYTIFFHGALPCFSLIFYILMIHLTNLFSPDANTYYHPNYRRDSLGEYKIQDTDQQGTHRTHDNLKRLWLNARLPLMRLCAVHRRFHATKANL